jgi:hypothetical protein
MEGIDMKRLITGLVAVLLAAPVVASAADTKAPVWKNETGLHETKDIIGTRVKNAQGKDLGEIDQLLIDRHGKVTHAVIGMGGLAGVGEKKVVVPWSELKFAPVAEGKKNSVVIDEARLESAPRYDRSARAADTAPAASPSTSPAKDSDRDGKPNRTDRAPLDPTRK